MDTHTPILEQAVLADFMAEGHFARHLRRMRTLYAERQAALLEAMRPLPLEMHAPEAGIHCLGWLPPGLNAQRVAEQGAAHGLALTPISKFCLEPLSREGLVLGFAEFSPAAIREGARRLATLLRAL
jgi:GntR family transcriptional regulator/MocR family aminotransferase